MEIYQNLWRQKTTGTLWLDELHLPGSDFRRRGLEQAIYYYNATDQRKNDYLYTLVINPEKGTCLTINIESEIYDSRSSFQKEWDIGAARFDEERRERHA